jgi:hypothetical protein
LVTSAEAQVCAETGPVVAIAAAAVLGIGAFAQVMVCSSQALDTLRTVAPWFELLPTQHRKTARVSRWPDGIETANLT